MWLEARAHAHFVTTEIPKSQFKAKALEYVRQVETSGEPLIITDHGHRNHEIRPYTPRERDPLEILRGSVPRYDHPSAPAGDEDWAALR